MSVIDIFIEPSKPQYEILTSTKQINLFLAGQGAGKTHCAGLQSGLLIEKFPKVHGFIGANTYTQLSDSTMLRIRQTWKEFFGWSEFSKENLTGSYVVDVIPPNHFNTDGHDYESYHGKICFKWGTVVYKGSLDNYKAHDGKEFGWAILDETKDTREEAVKEVIIGRLRQKGIYTLDENHEIILDERGNAAEAWNPLFIFTSPAKVQWINEWFKLDGDQLEIQKKIYQKDDFFKKHFDNKLVVISSAYHNEKNLPANYIENQKKNLSKALIDMLVYGNPFSQTGGEYYPSFERAEHVSGERYPHPKYNEKNTLHHTFDFNYRPYMTSVQIQLHRSNDIWWIYVIGLTLTKPPKSRTAPLCDAILEKYGNHKSGGYVYGDWTKKSANTELAEIYDTAYDVINEKLEKILSQNWDRVKWSSVSKRYELLTKILEKKVPIRLLIAGDSNCAELIDDFIYIKEDPNGGKYKPKATDEATGKKYETGGHTLDALEYFIAVAFDDYL